MSPILPISSAESYVESAASQAAHIEQIKQLKRQLLLKQFELDTVLGVAHDMTARDHTVEELYHMLRLTLQGQRNVVQLLLFALEEDGFRVRVSLGCDLAEAEKLKLSPHLTEGGVTQPQAVEDLHLGPDWDKYELIIPILRQKQVSAYVFVGGLRSDFDRHHHPVSGLAGQYPDWGRGKPPPASPAHRRCGRAQGD
ncbi:hypothetical protein ACFQT0_13315 [Hymenobacter humi]|uniref:GAF domain-containing protein n=1 Tax=Hymenobacter humi TaxID=1411620 RepID=A0ABW2U7P2_9BACT